MVQLQIKRGTQSQIAEATLAIGEMVYATDTRTLHVGHSNGSAALVGRTIFGATADKANYADLEGCVFHDDTLNKTYIRHAGAWVDILAGAEPLIVKNNAFNKNYCVLATDIKMNGAQSCGSVDTVPRADHVHPSDTSREPAIAKSTAFNKNYCVLTTDIKMNGAQSYGSVNTVPRADHVHPVDASRAAAGLAAAAGLTLSATDKILGRAAPSPGAVEEITCTAAARSVLDDATVEDMRTTLGFGTLLEQWVAPPASPTSAGVKGRLAYDRAGNYLYVCVATDTWVRHAVERSWS
jgi:hypothetical protein